jgi:hypothetical protein
MQNTTSISDATLNQPNAAPVQASETENAERAFSLSLIFSGVRCILQYVVLPFILPVIGIAGDFSVVIGLVINVMALSAIIYSIRTFFKVNYKHKWRYLPVGLFAIVLLSAFLLLDIAEIATG